MNDGLISGAIHFAAQGAPSMITLWDKTRGQIKGVSAMTTYPLYLVTRNPDVKSIKDFSAKDKIAVPSIKISTQAIMLQMAAVKAFGEKEYAKLDPLTVSLSHPDATLAFTNNTAGVNAHSRRRRSTNRRSGAGRASRHDQLRNPRRAGDGAGADHEREIPRSKSQGVQGFFDALSEAIDIINKDKRAAAKLYLEAAQDTKNSVDDILAIITDKDYAYTLKPQKVFETAQFMAKIGSIKQRRRRSTTCSSPRSPAEGRLSGQL